MAAVRIVVNRQGIRALLVGPEITADLTARGRRVAAQAGPGNRVAVERGAHRARVAVITDTFDAMADEARDRSLTRAMDAAR